MKVLVTCALQRIWRSDFANNVYPVSLAALYLSPLGLSSTSFQPFI